jgi:ribonuclease Z
MAEKINITFLGTSQAIPTAKRNHTAVLMKYKSENMLIDCGEGTQRQFRKAHINPCKLTRIFITHWHGDHILGIPGLLQTLLLNAYSKKLYIYGPKGTHYFMKQIIKTFVPYNSIPLEIKEVSKGKVLETKDFIIESQPMKHSNPCNAYSFIEKSKLRINKAKLKKLKIKTKDQKQLSNLTKGKNIKLNGKTIKASSLTYKQEGRKIAIIFDTAINPNCHTLAKNSELIISEAVYLKNEKDLAKLHEHLTAEQAGVIAKKAKAKKLYLAHLSQRYDGNEKLIANEAKTKFKNTIIAEDLMSIDL